MVEHWRHLKPKQLAWRKHPAPRPQMSTISRHLDNAPLATGTNSATTRPTPNPALAATVEDTGLTQMVVHHVLLMAMCVRAVVNRTTLRNIASQSHKVEPPTLTSNSNNHNSRSPARNATGNRKTTTMFARWTQNKLPLTHPVMTAISSLSTQQSSHRTLKSRYVTCP